MAGQLVQVATETVTSAVASVTLTGIDSDDVYMLAIKDLATNTDNSTYGIRPTVSGTGDSTADKDTAKKLLKASGTFEDRGLTNQSWLEIFYLLGTGSSSQEKGNGIFYLYNFNNASEYSFITMETAMIRANGVLHSANGGAVETQAQSCDGVQIIGTANIEAGSQFTLYRVV